MEPEQTYNTTLCGHCTLLSQTPLKSNYQQIQLQLPDDLSDLFPAGQQLELHHPQLAHGVRVPVMRLIEQHNQLEGLYKIKDPSSCTLSKITANHLFEFRLYDSDYQRSNSASRVLALAQNEYLACAIRLAQTWMPKPCDSLLILWALNCAPPFKLRPSQFVIPGLAANTIASIPLLEDWGIPSRISCAESPGCYPGEILDLAKAWLEQTGNDKVETIIFGEKEFCEQTSIALKK